MNSAATDIFVRPRWQEATTSGTPQINNLQATLCVAFTVLIMAFSGLFSIFPILVFYALWLPRARYKGTLTLRPSKDTLLAYAIAAGCVISVLWSDNRTVTLRAGLELTSMIMCTIIAARVTDLMAFIKGLILGTTIALTATLINGGYGIDTFTNTYSLVGLLGSKNQVGFLAEIGIFSSLLFLFSKKPWIEKMAFSFIPLGINTVCLVLCRSATSTASLLAILGLSFAIWLLGRFPAGVRMQILVVGTALTVLAAIAGAYMGWQEIGLHLLGKDTTLTGRTYLWAEGIKTGLENPFLGHGFYAFWVPGQPEAEKLWFHFGIFGRTGFHFHNTFIHVFVDMGVVGLILISALIVITCHKSLVYMVRNGANLLAFYSIGIAFMFLIRSFVEVDLWGAFSLGIFLVYGILPRLAVSTSTTPAETYP